MVLVAGSAADMQALLNVAEQHSRSHFYKFNVRTYEALVPDARVSTKLIKAFVRPSTEYALAITLWNKTISRLCSASLSRAARRCLSAPPTTSIAAMQLMLGLPSMRERWLTLTGKFLRHADRATASTMLGIVRSDSTAASAPLIKLRKRYDSTRADGFDPTAADNKTLRADQHKRLRHDQLQITLTPDKPIQNGFGCLPPPGRPCWLVQSGPSLLPPSELRMLTLWRLGRFLPYVPCTNCAVNLELAGAPLQYTTRRHIERCLLVADKLPELRQRANPCDIGPDGYLNDVLADGRSHVTWLDVAVDTIEHPDSGNEYKLQLARRV
ncbi:hypothetical protein RI367_008771, partial [Sorochytrium milnesiophthora]